MQETKIFLRSCALCGLIFIVVSFVFEKTFHFSSTLGSALGVSFGMANLFLFSVLLRGLLIGGTNVIILLLALLAKGIFIVIFLWLILGQEQGLAYSAICGSLIFIPGGLLMATSPKLLNL